MGVYKRPWRVRAKDGMVTVATGRHKAEPAPKLSCVARPKHFRGPGNADSTRMLPSIFTALYSLPKHFAISYFDCTWSEIRQVSINQEAGHLATAL